MSWTCDVSIEEKVRQDCYNRGYEQGRKNPCDEIVAYIEELQNQVKEYQDKIEQGTLVELPCKVGDTIYIPWVYDNTCGISFHEIERIEIYKYYIYLFFEVYTDSEYLWTYIYGRGEFSISECGKKFFLTREEAEKRLKELQG